ncbi:MAG: hypothetical protein ACLSHC_06815 [Bilophila wadsworthia]
MNDKKTVSFGMALAIIFLPILVILLGGLVLRVGFLVPLMLATITASLLSITGSIKRLKPDRQRRTASSSSPVSSSRGTLIGGRFRPVSSCSSTGA